MLALVDKMICLILVKSLIMVDAEVARASVLDGVKRLLAIANRAVGVDREQWEERNICKLAFDVATGDNPRNI